MMTGSVRALCEELVEGLTGSRVGHAVAIVSGGMDSTVLAYLMHHSGARLTLLSFDYGQRHRTELDYARRTALALAAEHHVVDLRGLNLLLGGSALTDGAVDVPDGHYTDWSMRATVVPNRNAIMLDVAVGQAVVAGADIVVFGAHAGDHPVYPDCRPAFLEAFERAALIGNEGFARSDLRVLAPLITLSKADIAGIGARLGVPFSDTWSCYKGGVTHCGKCGTCVERREAFELAGVADPTVYGSVEEVW
jgi:7-cyano-7-deazaguanine synthase